ncbi:prepilin-type N-terminal cleavage/methylation domain-containing protein [Candidatus Uhrbacteria bacterium]|jgi:prepilin-type N-terminal cleavage/methylation domain-containing protein|nr:prepilin-type N-terminal cleavage/methylation domain-containing protein [Candidatus Uhrbacteria bacterium]MBT7717070.1 prepilin-type N-terminal cleavage/methylation domain-containing protein [Candidatus Uhrbacteria bacterium]
MNKPRGYTIIEVIAAVFVVAMILLIGIIVANPKDSLEGAYREQQLDGVRDYMEVMLGLEISDPDLFYEIALQVEGEKKMIGMGQGCDGSFGDQCEDAELSDTCLDIQNYLPEGFLEELPVDLSNTTFSRVRTGYYMLYEDDVLEVGVCDPSGAESVRLMSLIR